MAGNYREADTLQDVRAGYLTEEQLGEKRNKSPRTLRLERQRGKGPPYVRDGRQVLYPISEYRAWLVSKMVQPVRAK
jgi:hypothetical protein